MVKAVEAALPRTIILYSPSANSDLCAPVSEDGAESAQKVPMADADAWLQTGHTVLLSSVLAAVQAA